MDKASVLKDNKSAGAGKDSRLVSVQWLGGTRGEGDRGAAQISEGETS